MIALTFDDLPALTILKDQASVNYLNAKLLQGLKRNKITATGFVNESKIDELDRPQQIRILERWLKASMDLGNHTYSHESPNILGAAAYINDIVRGEPVTRGLLAARHRRIGWFRHPYLETGTPEAVKREIDDWLRAHGYRIAPVTIDADDWEFAEPYEDAIARKKALLEAGEGPVLCILITRQNRFDGIGAQPVPYSVETSPMSCSCTQHASTPIQSMNLPGFSSVSS